MNPDYLLAEYKSLREEIMKTQERRAQNERYGAGAAVAIYAWLATEQAAVGAATQPFLWFGWWLPFLLAVFGFFREQAQTRGVRRAGDHLADLQEMLDLDGFTWEKHNRYLRRADESVFGVSLASFWTWLAAIALTFVIAVTATGMICGAQECGPTALNDLYRYAPPPG